MKKFTSMIVMVLFTMSMFAFSPAGKAVKSLDFSGSQRILKAVNAQAPRQLNSGKRRVQQRAAEDFPIISEQPQGELRSYARSGKCYVTQKAFRKLFLSGFLVVLSDTFPIRHLCAYQRSR